MSVRAGFLPGPSKSLRPDDSFHAFCQALTQIPKFGILLVLVVVLVLGALGFRDRKETDVLQLICS